MGDTVIVYDSDFTVLGKYEAIVVTTNSVEHCERKDQGIGWINQYAFYFMWNNTNHQIWVYNIDKVGFHQMCNKVAPGIINRVHKRLTPQGPAPYDTKALGVFDAITVNESTVNHCGQTRGITWINPKAFYFKWSEGNEQIWVYDENVDSYLQITESDCISTAIQHKAPNCHPRIK